MSDEARAGKLLELDTLTKEYNKLRSELSELSRIMEMFGSSIKSEVGRDRSYSQGI